MADDDMTRTETVYEDALNEVIGGERGEQGSKASTTAMSGRHARTAELAAATSGENPALRDEKTRADVARK